MKHYAIFLLILLFDSYLRKEGNKPTTSDIRISPHSIWTCAKWFACVKYYLTYGIDAVAWVFFTWIYFRMDVNRYRDCNISCLIINI